MSKDELDFLIRGKKDLAKMNALTQAGLTAVRIDQIRLALIDLLVKAAGAAV